MYQLTPGGGGGLSQSVIMVSADLFLPKICYLLQKSHKEKNLIEKKLLSRDELMWLNSYHRNVYQKLSPFLGQTEKTWLRDTCKIL